MRFARIRAACGAATPSAALRVEPGPARTVGPPTPPAPARADRRRPPDSTIAATTPRCERYRDCDAAGAAISALNLAAQRSEGRVRGQPPSPPPAPRRGPLELSECARRIGAQREDSRHQVRDVVPGDAVLLVHIPQRCARGLGVNLTRAHVARQPRGCGVFSGVAAQRGRRRVGDHARVGCSSIVWAERVDGVAGAQPHRRRWTSI